MNKCKICGGFYDAGEKCNCEERNVPVKRFMTSAELKRKLEAMSFEQYNRYREKYMNTQKKAMGKRRIAERRYRV